MRFRRRIPPNLEKIAAIPEFEKIINSCCVSGDHGLLAQVLGAEKTNLLEINVRGGFCCMFSFFIALKGFLFQELPERTPLGVARPTKHLCGFPVPGAPDCTALVRMGSQEEADAAIAGLHSGPNRSSSSGHEWSSPY